jgi:hypothetical protein
MDNFARVRNAIEALLLASGHFVGSISADVEGHPDAAGWVLTFRDGGRFIVTVRTMPDDEMAKVIADLTREED